MTLNLISCNIRFDNPADQDNSWAHRRDFLVEVLLKHSPDIIATQEGRFDQLHEFNDLLKDFILIDHHRSWIKARMYPTIFIRKNKFEIMKSEDLWLSETPEVAGSSSFESTFPRLMTYVSLQLKGVNQKIFVVNCHLDHVKPETRLKQIQVLAEETKRHSKDQPLVVMGDFNDSPESAVRQQLQKELPDLVDSWKAFHAHEETSHHAFLGEMENGARIDWVMTDKSLKLLSSEMDKTERQGKYPTDHFPIITKFSF
jgi:endonuclease/exonuclease/phosphatase family metal-dependent hydrolase